MKKRITATILAVVIIATAVAGCGKAKPQNEKQLVTQAVTEIVSDTESFKLSYSQSDSLNPYESDTLNNQIVQDLVFEPLFRLDESFEAEPEIASSYAYTDSKTLSVSIVSGLKFSDGSSLTAKDIVGAFNSAKASPYWKNSLEAISSAKKLDDTTIEFKLAKANPYAHQLLTFSIAKANQGKSKYPIGSGRYKFNESHGKIFLELNKEYKEEFNPRFTQISLINIPAADSINNAINIGNISYAYRDSMLDEVARLRVNKKRVNLNNLVYIGLNSSNGVTANKFVRQAISLAVDRSVLVQSAYQGYAKAATSIFNPSSKLGINTKTFTTEADQAAAKQAIVKSQYNDSKLKLTLLVKSTNTNMYSAAKLIKQELEAVGFMVTLKAYNNKDYKECLKNGSYNLYIGETKIPNDLRLDSFFDKKGKTRFGINTSSETAKAYAGYLNGSTEIGGFTLSFSQEMPFVPLLYKQGIICYSKTLHGDMQGYYGSYFSNIEDWYYN